MSEIVIRHVETTDAQALHHLYSQTPVYRDTLQLPLPSVESWQKRLANPEPGTHNLAAFIDGQLAGQLAVMLNQRAPPPRGHLRHRRRSALPRQRRR